MNEISKIELNAVIERLIESSGSDVEAQEILVSYASAMKSGSSSSMEISAQSNGDTISGATYGSGTVKMELDSKHNRNWSFGGRSTRVGYYKLSRKTVRPLFRRKEEWLLVTDFWKSDPATQSENEDPEAWCLSWDSNMRPLWFGKVASLELFHTGQLSVLLREVHEKWGPRVGRKHPLDVQISARMNI